MNSLINSSLTQVNSDSNFTLVQNTELITIATDAEWHSPDGSWLATTFACSNGNRFLFYTATATVPAKARMQKWSSEHGVLAIETTMTDDTDLLTIVLDKADPLRSYTTVRLLMFYSPKDLEYSCGWSKVSEWYKSKQLQQKRNISNRAPIAFGGRKLVVKDCKGWAGVGGLKKLADTVGVSMIAKGDMDEYKSRMREGMELKPETFAAYAMGDTDDLLKIHAAFVKLVRWVQADVIGIPENDCFTSDDIPMTTGALVAATLEKFLYAQAQHKDTLKFCLRKLGLLDVSAKDYRYSLATYIHATKSYRSASDLQAAVSEPTDDKLMHFLTRASFEHTGISQAGVKYFAKVTQDSAAFAALVQGGRCNNERPTEYYLQTGADIDLQSCYGSALRSFVFPVGLPTVWAFAPNQERMTLREWLKRNERQLVPGLWTATVNADLSYRQDLIYSKLVTQAAINRAGVGEMDKETNDSDRDDDLSHIPGTFALLRKQIRNGIITSDILSALRKVATSNELKQIMDAEIVTAVAYLTTDRVSDLEQWQAKVIADKGAKYNNKGKHNQAIDTRTRAWYGLELESFIGKLVNERNKLKQLKKTLVGDELAMVDAKQESLKLFVNTTYGVIASPYFSVGNTVVGNNITARARLGAWMLNKALHTRQSITDGGFYSLLEVPVLRENAKLPGLDGLSDNTKWNNRDYTRVTASLGGVNWAEVFADNGEELQELDKLAGAHINNFWSRYTLELPFAIEHKLSNTFTVAAYWSKAHYHLETLEGKSVVKIRGAKNYSNDSKLRKSPMYALLDAIANKSDQFPTELEHDQFSLLKIGKWLEAEESNNSDSYINIRGKRPGDEVIEQRLARLGNGHIFADTEKEYLSRIERATHKKGQPVQFFERFGEHGIAKVHKQMLIDNLNLSKQKSSNEV